MDEYTRVTNENWRGKNDPAERRRIQNRLNQRAFRQRQRAGESPKQYKPRSGSGGPPSRQEDAPSPPPQDEEESETVVRDGPPPLATSTPRTDITANTITPGRVWDELAQLINRNLVSAAVSNAQHLGIDSTSIRTGAPILTPGPSGSEVPTSLHVVQLQTQIPHDPIIDIIPHARLRYNVLRAIALGQLDVEAFVSSLRASGALECVAGTWMRVGVVVWHSPEVLGSWEVGEAFVRRFGFLLQGCEDLLAASNGWRGRRGEKLFPQSFNQGE